MNPSSQPTRPVLAERTRLNKKVWPWLITNFLAGICLGGFLLRVWQEPLIFFSVFQGEIGSLVRLSLVSLVFLLPLAVPAVITPSAGTKPFQAGFSALGVFLSLSLKPLPLWLGGILALLAGIISFWFTSEAKTRTTKLVAPYLREIFSPAAKASLLLLIFATLLTSFAALRVETKEGTLGIPLAVAKGILKPSVKVFNHQLTQQLTTRFGDRFQAALGTRDQQQILEFVKAELIEATQEGGVRQVFGFRADKLNLEKIIITPEGEIDLWPAVEASLPDIIEKFNQNFPGDSWLLVLGLVFIQGLIFWSWFWAASLVFPLLLALEIKVLTTFGYLKEKEESVTVIRLTL